MRKVVNILLIAALITAFLPVEVTTASSILMVSPDGDESIKPEARDFATMQFADPWDMSNREDIGYNLDNFRNVRLSGSKFYGTTNNTGGHIWLLWGGYPGSYGQGREGVVNKIRASLYNRLSFKLYSSKRGHGRLWWFYTQNFRSKQWVNIDIETGWHYYQINLPSTWSGYPLGARFDPIMLKDANVILDWVRLTPKNVSGASSTIAWSDSGDTGEATIYLDNDNQGHNGVPIRTVTSNNGTNTNSLDTSGLTPGNYYVYLMKNGEVSGYAPGRIQVNQAPILKITEPDITGGTDWAAKYLRNSWNMSSFSDVRRYQNIGSKRISGGVFGGTNYAQTRANDPFMWMRQSGKLINTNYYRFATIKYKYAGSFDLHRGTMARFMWLTSGGGWNTSDDIVTYGPSWETITVDLKKIKLNGGRNGWRGRTAIFRFDPHEDRLRRRFYIDYIKLAVEDRLSSTFTIRYWKKDFNHPYATLKLYYDADKSFGNGNEHIITTKTIGNKASYHRWRASRNLRRKVWIYAQVNDGINTVGYYSSGMLRVHI